MTSREHRCKVDGTEWTGDITACPTCQDALNNAGLESCRIATKAEPIVAAYVQTQPISREQPTNETKPIKHTVNGDEQNGWYCYACDFSTRSVTLAAAHDGAYDTDKPAAPTPAPLEAREWLKANYETWRLARVAANKTMYGDEPLAEVLSLYSSHVNAALMEKLETAEGELRAIDAILDRRTALDGFKTRWEKIQHAINTAGKTPQLESRISELEREQGRLRALVSDHCATANGHGVTLMVDENGKSIARNFRAIAVESQLSTTQEALRKCRWKLYECGMELSYVQEAEVLSLCKSAKGEALCNEVMQLLGVDYSIETEEELQRVLSPPTKLP